MTEAQLERVVRRLPRRPALWDKLTRDQKICVLIACLRPRFAIFSDPGAGKTVIAMTVADHHRKRTLFRSTLVLVPRRANKDEWFLQVEEHLPRVGCTVLRGSSEDKWCQLEQNENLLVVETYAGLTRLVCDLSRGSLRINQNLLANLKAQFGGFVFDESSALGAGSKAETSLIFEIANQLTENAETKMVLPMSGTPFGRDPSLLWAQMYLVDRGETLGRSPGLFKAAFFGEPDYWGKSEFLKSRQKDLHRLLANNSIRFRVSESELPRRRPLRRYVSIPPEQQDWLDRFYDVLAHDPDRQKKESAFLRIRQLSSGFVGFVDDESGERAQVTFIENPKLEALCDYALSIPEDYQFVVFHEWIVSGEWIAREFDRLGIGYLTLRGGTRDPEKVLRSFREGSKKSLIINHKSGSLGLNLQNARYALFYESPVSAIDRKQGEARVVRRYSRNKWAAIVDFVMKGTMDERVLKFHLEAEELFDSILNGREAVRS